MVASVHQPLRLMRNFMTILVVAVLGIAAESSVEVTATARASYAVDEFTCVDAVGLVPPNLPVESPLIMQVVNKQYLKMQENFLLIMKQNAPHRIDSIYLFCLDDVSAATMDDLFDLPCVRLDNVTNLRQIWVTRAKILVCLLQGGHDVMMSDNDALWLADPIPDLRAMEGDILVQRGVAPKRFGDPVYGVTMCMGFVVFRAGGDDMGQFLEVMADAVHKTGDDQAGLNMAAKKLGLEWDYNETRSDMRNAESTGVGRGVLADLPGNLSVTLLPHNRYTRDCTKSPVSPETIIAHCFPRHNRERAMKDAGLWFAD